VSDKVIIAEEIIRRKIVTLETQIEIIEDQILNLEKKGKTFMKNYTN